MKRQIGLGYSVLAIISSPQPARLGLPNPNIFRWIWQSNWSVWGVLIMVAVMTCIPPAMAGEREEYAFAYSLFKEAKNYALAKDQFQAFLRDYPQSEQADDARFLMGECALRLEAYDEAVQHYEKLINDYPNSPLRLDAVYGVGTAWFRQGRYEEAIKAYEEVIKGAKDAPILSQSLYLTGKSYDNLGLYQRAVEYYDRVLTQYPQAAEAQDARYDKGWGLYRLQKYREAYNTFTQLIQTAPNHYAIAEATYRAAESLFKLEEWANAQKAYQKVITTYADEEEHRQLVVDARFRLGECYFQQRMMEEAKQLFSRLLQEPGASTIAAEAQYWIAEILLEQKKYDEAIYEYQKVVDLYPKSDVADDAQYGVAIAYFQQADYAKARSRFKLVAEDLRSDLSDAARFYIGECFRLQREFNSAILNYKKVQGRSAYHDDALYGLATSAFELRDYPQAIRTLNSLIQTYPSSTLKFYALHRLGLTYFRQKAYQKSVEALDRFLTEKGNTELETAPTDEAIFWKARALYELEDYPATIKTCEQLIQNFPNSSLRFRAEFFIAESVYWSEQTPQTLQAARQKYQELLKKQPTGEWAEKCRYGIGWTHFSEAALLSGRPQTTHYQDAIKAWEEVLQHHQGSEFADNAQFHIGIASVNLKRYNDAIDAFTRVVANYPGSDWQDNARYQTGQAYYKQENYPRAITAFDDMLRQHPGSPLVSKAIFGKANAYFKQGKYTQAIESYQSVVDRFPNQKLPIREAGAEPITDLRPEAQYFIAESYQNLQNYAESIRAYENVLKHYPKSDWADDAQYGIALAYENLGEQEKAVQAYRVLMQKYSDRAIAPDVQVKIGTHYFQNKDYTRAIAEFQKVIDQYPNTSGAHFAQYKIGESYVASGSYRNAIEAFEKVSPESEFAARAAYQIGYIWYDGNNPTRNLGNAVRALLQVPEKHPKSPDAPAALLLAGQCYEELVEWNKAAEIYAQITKSYPRAKQAEIAQLLLGDALLKQKKYQEALKAYDVIRIGGIDRYPADIVIDATLRKAETQSLIGTYDEAAKTYLRVFYLYKQHDSYKALYAVVGAAEAYTKAGATTNAKDEYQKAIEFYQSNISTIRDATMKKKWEQLYNISKSKLEQLVNQLEQQ